MTRGNDPLNPASAAVGATGPVMHDVTAPKANEPEKVYYEGSPLVRGNLGSLLLFFLVGLALIAAPFLYWYLSEGNKWPAWWVTLVMILIGLVLLIAPSIYARTIRYRISNYRIDFERGLLGKTIDTTELWHVDDIRFNQSIVERLLGVGTITIFASDQTTPSLPLRGIPKPREIFDALKARVIAIKRSRGVIKMDA
jgi:membrane protein YdbS with pleckstrin-like domain